jgi:N-acetylmuramoyl-L-alanine amidase
LASAIAEGVRQYFTTLAPAGTLYAARSEQTRSEKSSTAEHVVGRGETLSTIAARHGVPVAALRQANNKRNDRVRVGERLAIPLAVASAPK